MVGSVDVTVWVNAVAGSLSNAEGSLTMGGAESDAGPVKREDAGRTIAAAAASRAGTLTGTLNRRGGGMDAGYAFDAGADASAMIAGMPGSR